MTFKHILCIIEPWQTLIAGLLAFVGAIITVWIINKQIRQTYNIEETRRKRNERAARILLPSEFRRINSYAIKCMIILSSYIQEESPAKTSNAEAEVPQIHDSVFGPLQEWTRHADDRTVSDITNFLSLTNDTSEWFSICIKQVRQKIPKIHAINKVTFCRVIVNFTEIIIRSQDLFCQASGMPRPHQDDLEQRFLETLDNIGVSENKAIISCVQETITQLRSSYQS